MVTMGLYKNNWFYFRVITLETADTICCQSRPCTGILGSRGRAKMQFDLYSRQQGPLGPDRSRARDFGSGTS